MNSVFHSDPDILGGIPVFTGTRVPVQTLLTHLLNGRLEDFFVDFPTVERWQVEALLRQFQQMLQESYT